MTEELLNQVITGAPNFVGFILLALALLRVIGKQNELIVLLIGKWENCEKDEEKVKLIK